MRTPHFQTCWSPGVNALFAATDDDVPHGHPPVTLTALSRLRDPSRLRLPLRTTAASPLSTIENNATSPTNCTKPRRIANSAEARHCWVSETRVALHSHNTTARRLTSRYRAESGVAISPSPLHAVAVRHGRNQEEDGHAGHGGWHQVCLRRVLVRHHINGRLRQHPTQTHC